MPEFVGQLGLGALVIAAPLAAVTLCMMITAVVALFARRPSSRRHYLNVLSHLTKYVEAMRCRGAE